MAVVSGRGTQAPGLEVYFPVSWSTAQVAIAGILDLSPFRAFLGAAVIFALSSAAVAQVGPSSVGARGPEAAQSDAETRSTDEKHDADRREVLISVKLAGDAYQGNPDFIIRADDEEVGRGTVTWAREFRWREEPDPAPAEWRVVTFRKMMPVGHPRTVTVSFTNDRYNSSTKQDRNLLVEYVEVDGHRIQAETIRIMDKGGQVFDFGPYLDEPLKASELRFVRQTDQGFEGIEVVRYGEPFFLEARFEGEPQEDNRTVNLEWGEGKSKEVVVIKTDDSKVFRSQVIKVERPAETTDVRP